MIWSMNIQFFIQCGIHSQQFFHFHIKKYGYRFGSSLIIWYRISVRMRMYIGLSFILSEVLMEGFFYQRSQLHLLERLPLSLCTYPFFIFAFWIFVYFRKQDLAQDCPFLLIPGFLWIWKLSLGRFPYQGSIQLSP